MKAIQSEHKNWKILITSTDRGHQFHACLLDHEPITNGRNYKSIAKAIRKAKKFCDRIETLEKIEDLLERWLRQGKITRKDCRQIEALLQEFFCQGRP